MNFKINKTATGPELNAETANQMLENVFNACNVEPNAVPLDVLTSYSNYRKERYAMQRWIIIIAVIAWILIPLLFIAPKFNVVEKYADTGMPKYEVYVHTMLPISKVTASVENKNISIYEMDPHNFSLQPSKNGTMDITITLFNRQYTVEQVMVDSYDDQIPELVSSDTSGDYLLLQVSDSGTGINYNKINGTFTDGTEFLPLEYDEENGTITFPYPEEEVNLYIPDYLGNTLHLLITLEE